MSPRSRTLPGAVRWLLILLVVLSVALLAEAVFDSAIAAVVALGAVIVLVATRLWIGDGD